MRSGRLVISVVVVLVLSAPVLLAQRGESRTNDIPQATTGDRAALSADLTLTESYDSAIDSSAQERTISRLVKVTNFPPLQEVAGTVNVGNLPAIQEISGTVTVAGSSATKRFQLVGFTTASFQGSQGILNFARECQSEFPSSRMCSSREIVETTAIPSGFASGDAWVRPLLMPWPTGISQASFDFSGTLLSPSESTCLGWSTNSSSKRGLVVAQGGQLVQRTCDSLHAVACCALVD